MLAVFKAVRHEARFDTNKGPRPLGSSDSDGLSMLGFPIAVRKCAEKTKLVQ